MNVQTHKLLRHLITLDKTYKFAFDFTWYYSHFVYMNSPLCLFNFNTHLRYSVAHFDISISELPLKAGVTLPTARCKNYSDGSVRDRMCTIGKHDWRNELRTVYNYCFWFMKDLFLYIK